MNHVIIEDNPVKAIKLINQHRLANKNKWIFVELHYNNSVVLLKSFNTSIQILKKNNIQFPTCSDTTISNWKKTIQKAL